MGRPPRVLPFGTATHYVGRARFAVSFLGVAFDACAPCATFAPMCGRYVNMTPVEAFGQIFRARPLPLELPPRYNVAPSQDVLACRSTPGGEGGELVLLHWGLVPHWAKDPKSGYSMINARAETVAQKPASRSAFRDRRCLVAADGFYEWKPVVGRKAKQPHYVRLKGGGPLAFAGLWERWTGEDDRILESCTIIVTDANALLAPIHDRML